MPLIYFDESGNTGPDLRNPDQKSFALASVCFENEEAIRPLHDEIAKLTKSNEIKFSKIAKHSRRLTDLISVLEDHKNEYKALTTLFHKRYSIAGRIVDIIVEPQAHAAGCNLYKSGRNICYANMLFYCIQALCNEGDFELLEQLFIAMVRSKSSLDIQRYRKHLNKMIRSTLDKDMKARLKELNPKAEWIAEYIENIDGHSIDPAVTSFVTLCCAWGEKYSKFDVIHDQSKPMARSEGLLRTFMDQKQPSVLLGFDNRKGEFPLKCSSLRFGDSKEELGLQIADIFSGLVTCFANRIIDGNFDDIYKAIESLGIEGMIVNPVWPSPNVTPEQLGITDNDNEMDMVSILTLLYGDELSKLASKQSSNHADQMQRGQKASPYRRE